MVLQRAPGRGLQVPPGHQRLRGGPSRRAALRRPGRRRRRHRRDRPQHHRGHQPPRLPAAAGPRRRGGHHRRRAPRHAAPLGTARPASLRRVRPRGDVLARRRRRRPRRLAPAQATGHHRRVERDRLAAAPRRHPGGGAGAGDPGGGRRRPARPPPSAPAGGRLHRLERAQDVRPVRRRRPHRAPGHLRRGRPLPGRGRCRRPRRPRRGVVDRPAGAGGGRLPQRHRGRGPRYRLRRVRPPRLEDDHRARRRPRRAAALGPGRHLPTIFPVLRRHQAHRLSTCDA